MNTMKTDAACRAGVFLIVAGLACLAISCGSDPQVVEEPATNTTPTTAESVTQADELYAQREDLMRVRQGIILLNRALINDSGNYEASWKLSKFNYYLATHTENDEEREKAFREGIEAGKAAVKLEDGKPDGHFWLGANYGGSAQSSTLAGLSSVDDIRNEMDTVLRLDEGYQNGSAYMVLGLVYLQAPYLMGGDPKKAVEEMEKGLRFGQSNALLRLHLAEAYLKVGRKADAREQLNSIISMTPDPNYLPEYNDAVTQAQKLLEKTG